MPMPELPQRPLVGSLRVVPKNVVNVQWEKCLDEEWGVYYEVKLPLHVIAGKNHGAGHWAGKSKWTKDMRRSVDLLWPRGVNRWPDPMWVCDPKSITLVRIAPRPLDTDSLAYSFAPIRDEVALQLGLGKKDSLGRHVAADGPNDKTKWEYRNERGKPREYAIRIELRF